MLTQLRIRNYALIKELELPIQSGFSIITGETGAGKSIILGALSLILGQRTDSSVLKDTTQKCVVEGIFEIESYQLESFFIEHDLDWESQTIIRREISPAGKSRAFVNDTPVNLKVLRSLSLRLLDIHSQHQNLEMGKHHFQLEVVDACAELSDDVTVYATLFKEWSEKKKHYETIVARAEKEKSDLDYFQFQFEQLNDANLVEDEQVSLEKELEQLNHAEDIQRTLSGAHQLLQEEGPSIVNQLRDVEGLISKIVSYLPAAEELHKRMESTYLEIRDIANDVELLASDVVYNPVRASEITDRLDLIYTLQQKHRVSTILELIELKNQFEEKIDLITNSDDEIERCLQEINMLESNLRAYAAKLTDKRLSTIPTIQNQVNDVLSSVGMPNGQFKVELDQSEVLLAHGVDIIRFLFSGNKNQEFSEISKVASGGEISRLMLAIKSLLAQKKSLPTILFDEIDTGISGEVAGKMGALLKKMSSHLQIINITHLPQVAAQGDHHYWVYKEDTETETITRLKVLSEEERLTELAKMLSGENVTEAALNNAQDLFNQSYE